jgi:uncharacterized protein YndB with AHSA1/START domain
VRITESFEISRPPETVFDYVTNPVNLAKWQTSKIRVEKLTDGPPGLGAQFREWTKPSGGKEFEQVVEFTEFDRPNRLHVHIVEGPYPVDGTWSFDANGDGTRVHFVAEGRLPGLMRALEPVLSRLMARQFAGFHRNLRGNLEAD